MTIEIYIIVSLVLMDTDAVFCFHNKIKYRIFASALLCFAWPVTIPIMLIRVARISRHWPVVPKEGV